MIVVNKELEPRLDMVWYKLQRWMEICVYRQAVSQNKLDEECILYLEQTLKEQFLLDRGYTKEELLRSFANGPNQFASDCGSGKS